MDDQRVRHNAVLDTKRRFTEAAEHLGGGRYDVDTTWMSPSAQPDAGRSHRSNAR